MNDLIFEQILEAVQADELSYEEAYDLLIDLDDDYDDDTFEEGANLELVQLYRTHISECKDAIKKAKKFIRKKEYTKAKNELKDIPGIMDKIKKLIKEGEDTAIEKILGVFFVMYDSLIFQIFSIASAMASITAATKAAGKFGFTVAGVNLLSPGNNYARLTGEWVMLDKATVDHIKDSVNKAHLPGAALASITDIISLITLVIKGQKVAEGKYKMLDKKMDKEGWWRVFTSISNPFRSYVYQICDETSIVAKRLIKQVDELESFVKKSEKMDSDIKKESVDEMRLRVYDAFEEGKIDEIDKDLFLNMLDINNY